MVNVTESDTPLEPTWSDKFDLPPLEEPGVILLFYPANGILWRPVVPLPRRKKARRGGARPWSVVPYPGPVQSRPRTVEWNPEETDSCPNPGHSYASACPTCGYRHTPEVCPDWEHGLGEECETCGLVPDWALAEVRAPP